MKFNLEKVVEAPDPVILGRLQKSDLLEISAHLKLGAKPAMWKRETLRVLLKHFINNRMLEEVMLLTV